MSHDQVLQIEADNEDLLSSEDTEPETTAMMGIEPEEPSPPLWVVAKGRTPSDIGIYATWTEAQQSVGSGPQKMHWHPRGYHLHEGC